jgi:hypothetical protein
MYYTYVLQSEVDHQFYVGYIDLNPLRAGIVSRPEEYRWNSIGYHIQTGNKDNFLSLDFGLKEFGPGEIRSAVTSAPDKRKPKNC